MRVLVDTSVWYSIYDTKETRQSVISAALSSLDNTLVVFPWPVLYEVLRTKFVKRPLLMEQLELRLARPNVIKADDCKYRESALRESFAASKRHRNLSLVDCVLRQVLLDEEQRIDYFLTLNLPDFVDVCRQTGVQVYSAMPAAR